MALNRLQISSFLLLMAAGAASAAEPAIGLSAPLSGAYALLGGQIRDGASLAAADRGATLDIADDACTAEGGAAAARQFAAKRVAVVVGFLCTEAIEAALPVLKDAGIPAIAVGVRTDSLTDRRQKTGWPVFRLGPRADGEARAIAEILPALWSDKLFAIVDDGTIYGRDLAEGFRAAAEQAGLKPVFVDALRPGAASQAALAGRLKRAGATHVFLGGDPADAAILERDSGGELTLAGGETLSAANISPPLQPGTLMIGLAEPTDRAEPALLARFRQIEVEPEGYVLPAYAAVEAAVAAVRAGKPLESLASETLPTVLGPIRFDANGDLAENPFRLFRFDGSRFTEAP